MKNRSRITILIIILLTVTAVTTAMLQVRNQTLPSQNQIQQIGKGEFPITEASTTDALEMSDPKKLIKKHAKSKKYEQYKGFIGPGVTVSSVVYHWPDDFSPLPIRQSSAVVIGKISDAKASIINEGDNVYSEFTVNVTEILKNDDLTPIFTNNPIIVERLGGRVKYPSGNVALFSVEGWGMPQVGNTYVLFLSRNIDQDDYQIITGYELRDGRVFPLDRTTSNIMDFDAYTNTDASTLIEQIQSAATTSQGK